MIVPAHVARRSVSIVLILTAVCSVVRAETIRVERVPPDGPARPLPDWRAPSEPRWGLALGGGGAWGLAHLGFLGAMEEDGLRPPLLAGTSAGALAGATYATGIPLREIEAVFRAAERDPRRSLIDAGGGDELVVPADPLSPRRAPVRFGPAENGRPLPWRGLFPETKLSAELARYFARASADAGNDLDRLFVPFRAVSADLAANETYAPRYGSLPLLVRASISLPLFAPVRIGDRVLVDGGVFEEVPVPTLSAQGAHPVIGVRLTDEGDDFGDLPEKFGFRKLAALYDERIIEAHRRDVVDSADVRVDLRVGDASPVRFLGQLDALLAAGREAWSAHREHVLQAIEGRAPETVRIVRVDAATSEHRAVAEEVAARLGIGPEPAEPSRLRIELELVRLLRQGWADDARLEVGDDGVAELRLVEAATVRSVALEASSDLGPWLDDLDRSAWVGRAPRAVLDEIAAAVVAARRDGMFLAGIRNVDWDPVSGALEVTVDPGIVSGVDLTTLGDGPDGTLRPVPRDLLAIAGRAGHLDRIRAVLEGLARRDLLQEARLVGARNDGRGGYRVEVEAEAPPRRRTTLTFGIGDATVPTVGWALALPDVGGSRWGVETRLIAGREGILAGTEVAVARDRGIEPYVRLVGGRPVLPLYDPGGGSDGRRWMSSAAAAAGARLRIPVAGAIEAGLSARWASASAFQEDAEGRDGADVALEAAWCGTVGDHPVEPFRRLDWRFDVSAPFAGRSRAVAASLDVGGRVRLGERRRWGVDMLARSAWTDVAEPLPLDRWPEAGAWVEAPGLAPGRSRARSVTRGTALVRRSLGPAGPFPLRVGLSAGAWRLDEVRVDPALPDRGAGAALFAEVGLPRGTTLTVGWAASDFDGDRFFVLLDPTRADWPGVRVRLPGR